MYIQISHAGHIYISLQIVLLNYLNNHKLNRIWTGTLLFLWHLMNLDRNSAVPMALDERTPTLNVAQNRNVAVRKGSGQQSGESGTFFHYNLYFLYSYCINNFLQMFELKELSCIKFCLGTLLIIYPHFIKLPLTNIYNMFSKYALKCI